MSCARTSASSFVVKCRAPRSVDVRQSFACERLGRVQELYHRDLEISRHMQSGPYSVVPLRQLTGLIVQAVDVDTIWDCRHTIHIDLIEEDDHEVRWQ